MAEVAFHHKSWPYFFFVTREKAERIFAISVHKHKLAVEPLKNKIYLWYVEVSLLWFQIIWFENVT